VERNHVRVAEGRKCHRIERDDGRKHGILPRRIAANIAKLPELLRRSPPISEA
jgi:hypothetical protein